MILCTSTLFPTTSGHHLCSGLWLSNCPFETLFNSPFQEPVDLAKKMDFGPPARNRKKIALEIGKKRENGEKRRCLFALLPLWGQFWDQSRELFFPVHAGSPKPFFTKPVGVAARKWSHLSWRFSPVSSYFLRQNEAKPAYEINFGLVAFSLVFIGISVVIGS